MLAHTMNTAKGIKLISVEPRFSEMYLRTYSKAHDMHKRHSSKPFMVSISCNVHAPNGMAVCNLDSDHISAQNFEHTWCKWCTCAGNSLMGQCTYKMPSCEHMAPNDFIGCAQNNEWWSTTQPFSPKKNQVLFPLGTQWFDVLVYYN